MLPRQRVSRKQTICHSKQHPGITPRKGLQDGGAPQLWGRCFCSSGDRPLPLLCGATVVRATALPAVWESLQSSWSWAFRDTTEAQPNPQDRPAPCAKATWLGGQSSTASREAEVGHRGVPEGESSQAVSWTSSDNEHWMDSGQHCWCTSNRVSNQGWTIAGQQPSAHWTGHSLYFLSKPPNTMQSAANPAPKPHTSMWLSAG